MKRAHFLYIDNEAHIMENLHRLFSSRVSFSFLKVIPGKDLIPVPSLPKESDAFGAAVLELTHGSDMYVVGNVHVD